MVSGIGLILICVFVMIAIVAVVRVIRDEMDAEKKRVTKVLDQLIASHGGKLIGVDFERLLKGNYLSGYKITALYKDEAGQQHSYQFSAVVQNNKILDDIQIPWDDDVSPPPRSSKEEIIDQQAEEIARLNRRIAELEEDANEA